MFIRKRNKKQREIKKTFDFPKRKFFILDQLMMCDNLSLYKTYIPSPANQLTTMSPQFYPTDDIDDEHRPYMSIKRKLSGTIPFDKRYHFL